MNKKMAFALLFAGASLGSRGRAIEIPLEGLGNSAAVAYVNIHKVFEAFPETEKARAELNQLIAQKKDDITAKHEEIAKLKGQIDFLKKQMGAVTPSTAPKTTGSQEPIQPNIPGSATQLTLPENSPLKFLFTPPDPSNALSSETNKTNYSTFTAQAPQILPGIPSPGPSLLEREAELMRKQSDLEAFIGASEEEVRQMEEGKTMTLMARIYKTLEDISAKQGYSVVMDRDNILYGESAIDITEQLIQRLNAPRIGR